MSRAAGPVAALDAAGIDGNVDTLSEVLAACVADGAAIGFVQPFGTADAARFWSRDVRPEVYAGRRLLLAVALEGRVAGAVQLLLALPPNQPHRCEIAKMIVHPRARRQGLGRALMEAALERADALGRTLVTLDTRTGDAAQALYAGLGFVAAGEIPGYALDPDGRATHGTTYMYRRLCGVRGSDAAGR